MLLCLIFYTYLGYPLGIYIKSIFRKCPISTCHMEDYPRVSIVIAARNEEKNIERRIRNIMNQNYPKDKLEVIIISDGSTDGTDDIVKAIMKKTEYASKGFLKFYSHTPSRGKPFCINSGVKAAKNEIIVLADCRQQFAASAIEELIKNFIDPKVGCVSGELIFKETPESPVEIEMGTYWRFEKWLRKLESLSGSVPGATGAIYAIRKELFQPIPVQTLLDDVLIPMRICVQGFRTIFESKAIAYDTVSKTVDVERKRKIRTLAGNWQLLALEPPLSNPFKNPLWLRFMSHKIFRLLVPYCLIALTFVSLMLRDVFSILFLTFACFFFLISVLPVTEGHLRIISKLTGISRTVIFLNYFAFLAPLKLLQNRRKLW